MRIILSLALQNLLKQYLFVQDITELNLVYQFAPLPDNIHVIFRRRV